MTRALPWIKDSAAAICVILLCILAFAALDVAAEYMARPTL
jgi:hypothetical protein